MRILFAGSPQLAIPSLEALKRSHSICAVLTNPDRPSGRGTSPEANPVKHKALELGLPLLQPRLFDADLLGSVAAFNADLLVVVAFGRILKKDFLDLFPLGGINLHASLLPRYRGPSPITAAILAGDRYTGVSVQKLALKMDSGDILAQQRIALHGDETGASLSATLAELGAGLLLSTLAAVAEGRARPVPQQEEQASYCRLVRKEDGEVDWNLEAAAIERMIRAYDPWPRAHTSFRGQRLNLLAGGVYPHRLDASALKRGLALAPDNRYGILVNTGGGVLYLSRLQLQAKKALDWRSFLNGQKDFVGSQLGDGE